MYKNLITRLREYSGARKGEIAELTKEAADAIEELSRAEEQWITQERKALLKSIPRWISVEERLPEQKINQNTLDFEYVLCATTFGDVRPYKYGRRIGEKDPHFWNGPGYVDAYITYWMPLPEPPKEET